MGQVGGTRNGNLARKSAEALGAAERTAEPLSLQVDSGLMRKNVDSTKGWCLQKPSHGLSDKGRAKAEHMQSWACS